MSSRKLGGGSQSSRGRSETWSGNQGLRQGNGQDEGQTRGRTGTYSGPQGHGRAGAQGGFKGGPPDKSDEFIYSAGSVPEHDARITKLEDETLKGLTSKMAKASLDGSALQSRPSYGTQGAAITVWANYVQLSLKNPQRDIVFYSYKMTATHVPTGSGSNLGEPVGRKLSRVIEIFLKQCPALDEYRDHLYSDFKAMLLTTKPLAESIIDVVASGDDETLRIKYTADEFSNPKEPLVYDITITPAGDGQALSFKRLLENVTDPAKDPGFNKLTVIQALNIFLNHRTRWEKTGVMLGANRTFPFGSSPDELRLGQGLVARRGFFSSVRPATGRVLLNVNVNCAAFYRAVRLDELIRAFQGVEQGVEKKPGGPLSMGLGSYLSRLRVKTVHLGTPRTKTICGLATTRDGKPKNAGKGQQASQPQKPAPTVRRDGGGPRDVEFYDDDKRRHISVYNHFLQKYNMELNPDLPVVNVGSIANPAYLPAEACHVLDGQVAPFKLSPSQTANMIDFAVRRPGPNATSIVQCGLETIGATDRNECLARAGVSVGQQLLTVPARILPSMKVMYASKEPKSWVNVSSGGWNYAAHKFNTIRPLDPRPFGVLNFRMGGRGLSDEKVRLELSGFQEFLRKSGFAQLRAESAIGSPGNYSTELGRDPRENHRIMDAIFKPFSPTPGRPCPYHFVLCILPEKDAELYNSIKLLCDVKWGVATVCVTSKNVGKIDRRTGLTDEQVFANIGMKINSKLGGINHQVESAGLSIVREGKTMVVGIDVTHPDPGSSGTTPSIAAMVACDNGTLGQWPGETRIQRQSRDEMVDDLTEMLCNRLELWMRRNNNTLPDNILVYRDGVSEGQYKIVQNMEIPQLVNACARVYGQYKKSMPKLTIVIVGKRHHTRFYPTSKEKALSGNCMPGTVVDRGITESGTWDFFLQSHQAIKGTARPVHYVVIRDDIFGSMSSPKPGGPTKGPPQLKLGVGARSQAGAQPKLNLAHELETLTYSLCNVFQRATRSVSYATPAYLADILCERARCYLAAASMFGPGPGGVQPMPQRYIDKIKDETERATQQGILDAALVPSLNGARRATRVHDSLKDTMFYL